MKCITNDNKIILYIKDNIKYDDFDDIDFVENYFKELFFKLKKLYNININGFYIINVYIDNIYGMILEIQNEHVEFIEYYNDTVDMTTSVHKAEFLYQVNDILDLYDSELEIYLYNNNYYIKLNNNNLLLKILEYVENIVYKDTDLILKRAKRI